MNTILQMILRRFKPQRSVASITSTFTKQVGQLHELAEQQGALVDACEVKLIALEKQADDAAAEAYNAQALAARIEAFTTI